MPYEELRFRLCGFSAGCYEPAAGELRHACSFRCVPCDVEVLETLHLLGDGTLRGQALDARGAKESANPSGSAEDVLNVLRLGDRAAMAQDQNFRMDGNGCLLDGLNANNRFIERDGCFGADGPFGG